jgi:hypothetical protein
MFSASRSGTEEEALIEFGEGAWSEKSKWARG